MIFSYFLLPDVIVKIVSCEESKLEHEQFDKVLHFFYKTNIDHFNII